MTAYFLYKGNELWYMAADKKVYKKILKSIKNYIVLEKI